MGNDPLEGNSYFRGEHFLTMEKFKPKSHSYGGKNYGDRSNGHGKSNSIGDFP